MRRIVETLVVSLVVFAAVAAGLVALTVYTPISAETMRLWVEAVGGVLAAAAAIIVALLGFRAQRLSAQEAAEAERRGAAEAAAAALETQRERFEEQRRMEHERHAIQEAMATRVQTIRGRHRAYTELLAYAAEKVSHPEGGYRASYHGLAEALAVGSNDILAAANAFESTPTRDNYETLIQLVRHEMASPDHAQEPAPSDAGGDATWTFDVPASNGGTTHRS